MSGIASNIYRSGSLNNVNVEYNNNNKTRTLSRSKSIERCSFSDIVVSDRYKVDFDLEDKENIIKHRIHLATLTGVVNLRKMRLVGVPDDIFYLEMHSEEKIKVKEEEIMLLNENRIQKPVSVGKIVRNLGITPTVRQGRSIQFIADGYDTRLPSADNKRREDNFQFFLDSHLPGLKYNSYGEIVKQYLKHKTMKFIGKTQCNSPKLEKCDLYSTAEMQKDLMMLKNVLSEFSVEAPQETALLAKSCMSLSKLNQDVTGLMTKYPEKITHQDRKRSNSKIPRRVVKQQSVNTKTYTHKQAEFLEAEATEKLQIKNTHKSATGNQIPVKMLRQKSIHSKIPRHQHPELSLQAKNIKEAKIINRNRCTATGNLPSKDTTHDQEYCFLEGYSLIGINPYTGEKICILKDVHDTDEIKRKVSSFFDDLASTLVTDKEESYGISGVYTLSTSSSESGPDDAGNYSDFENAPEKYIFFKGDALMYENPLTGEEFCIFENIRNTENIKNELTEFLMSCVSENKKEVTYFTSAQEISVSPYSGLGNKIASQKVLVEHTSKDTNYEDNATSAGGTYASDSLCKESNEGYSLIRQMSYLGTNMRPVATSTPTFKSVDSENKNELSDKNVKKVKKHSVSQKQSIIKEMAMSERKGNGKLRESHLAHDVKPQQKTRKNISFLLLDNNELEQLSWRIGYLTNLTTIHLENNNLTIIPNEIRKLQKLEKLHLDNNRISALPIALYYLTSLRHLSVKKNKLIHVSVLLRYMDKLETLDISHNYLTELPKDIYKLRQLKHLDVSKNKLTSLPDTFPGNLQAFFANDNKIDRLPNLMNLRKLRVLSIHSNQLKELPHLASSIKKIYASQNYIYGLNESLIENWTELETLSLRENQLFKLPENIHTLVSLKKLRLSCNQLHSLPTSMERMHYLEEFDINMNPLLIPHDLLNLKLEGDEIEGYDELDITQISSIEELDTEGDIEEGAYCLSKIASIEELTSEDSTDEGAHDMYKESRKECIKKENSRNK